MFISRTLEDKSLRVTKLKILKNRIKYCALFFCYLNFGFQSCRLLQSSSPFQSYAFPKSNNKKLDFWKIAKKPKIWTYASM